MRKCDRIITPRKPYVSARSPGTPKIKTAPPPATTLARAAQTIPGTWRVRIERWVVGSIGRPPEDRPTGLLRGQSIRLGLDPGRAIRRWAYADFGGAPRGPPPPR